MEPDEDDSSHQQPKKFKPTNHTGIPSTSSKYSILADPNLPELLISILVRFPVKYVVKLKLVCKNWRDLISSPEFVMAHLSFSAKDSTRHRLLLKLLKLGSTEYDFKHCSVSSLFYEPVTEAFDLDYPVRDAENPYSPVCIVGSVNGLICYRIKGSADSLVLWNPSTRKCKQVPSLVISEAGHDKTHDDDTQMNKDHFSYGFGYDKTQDDYKIVAIFGREGKEKEAAKIYSLKSDSWRTLDDFRGGETYHSLSKLVNGKLHWFINAGDSWGIRSIHLVREKWRKVELPCYGEGNPLVTLGVLGSDLSVICNYKRNNETMQADVWIMKEYGVKESWTKLYTIKNPIYMLSPPLCMSNEGELLAVLNSALMIYNSKDDLRRNPNVTDVNVDDSLVAEPYIESLVCPVL